jgi:hypothetical protein
VLGPYRYDALARYQYYALLYRLAAVPIDENPADQCHEVPLGGRR